MNYAVIQDIANSLKGAQGNLQELELTLQFKDKQISALQSQLEEWKQSKDSQDREATFHKLEEELRDQIQFLKKQLIEKDRVIQAFCQNDTSHSHEAFQQQNTALQNMINEMQSQILSKDNIITQLRTQDKSLDQLIDQLKSKIWQKSIQANDDVLSELQQIPDSLTSVFVRIKQQFNQLREQLDDKDKELTTLKVKIQCQLDRTSEKVMQIKQRESISEEQGQTLDDLIRKNLVVEDLIIELEQKLVLQQNKKDELEQTVNQYEKSDKLKNLSNTNDKIDQEIIDLEIRLQQKLKTKSDLERRMNKPRNSELARKTSEIDQLIGQLESGLQEQSLIKRSLVSEGQKQESEDDIRKRLSVVNHNKESLLEELQVSQNIYEIISKQIEKCKADTQVLNDQLNKIQQQQEAVKIQLQNQKKQNDLLRSQQVEESQNSSKLKSSQSLQQFNIQKSNSPPKSPISEVPAAFADSIQEQEAKIKFLTNELEQRDKYSKAHQFSIVALSEKDEQIRLLQSKISELQAQIKQLEQTNKQLSQSNTLNTTEITALQSKISFIQFENQQKLSIETQSLKDQIAQLSQQQEIPQIDQKVENLISQIIRFDELVNQLETQISDQQQKIEQQNPEAAQYMQEQTQIINDFLKEVQKSKIPKTEQPIELSQRRVNSQQAFLLESSPQSDNEVLQLRNEVEQLKSTLAKQLGSMSRDEELARRNLKYEQLVHNLESQLNQRKASITSYEKELTTESRREAEIKFLQEQADLVADFLEQAKLRRSRAEITTEDPELQKKYDYSDQLVLRNLEIDETIQNLEQRLIEKQSQLQLLGQGQQLISEENSIQKHQQSVNQLYQQIGSLEENMKQMFDDGEYEALDAQKVEKEQLLQLIKTQIDDIDEDLTELQVQKQDKEDLIERLKHENQQVDALIEQLKTEQTDLMEKSKDEERQKELESLIQQNLEWTAKLYDLKTGSNKLKQQIKNFDQLITDLQGQYKHKQDELNKITAHYHSIQMIVKKQKQKRDQLYKEQLPLAEKVGLLEQQVKELIDECLKLEPEFQSMQAQHQKVLSEMNELKEQNEIISKTKHDLAANIEANKQEIERLEIQNISQSDLLVKLRAENQKIEHEINLYQELLHNSDGLEIKVQQANERIKLFEDELDRLKEEQDLKQEQLQLIKPQYDVMESEYQNVKQQYDTLIQQVTDQQAIFEELKKSNIKQQHILDDELITQQQQEQSLQVIYQNNETLNIKIGEQNQVYEELQKLSDERVYQIQQLKDDKNSQLAMIEQLNQEKLLKGEQIQQLNETIASMKQKIEQNQSQQMDYQHKLEQIQEMERSADLATRQIYEKEQYLNSIKLLFQEKQNDIDKLELALKETEDRKADILKLQEQLAQQVVDLEIQLKKYESKLDQLTAEENKIQDQINAIDLVDMDRKLQDKYNLQLMQQQLIAEIEQTQEEVQKLESHKNHLEEFIAANKENEEKIQAVLKEVDQKEQQIQEQNQKLEALNKDLNNKEVQLEQLNDNFRLVDEECKMMEGVIAIKDKELAQYKLRKELLNKNLEIATSELVEVQKQIMDKKQQQKLESTLPQQQDNEEEEFQQQLYLLDNRKNNLIEDLNKLVNTPAEQIQQQDYGQVIKEREKRMEILEQTIQTLQQQQNVDRTSFQPSMFQSKISMQPSFYFDDDPMLVEFQEKFTKESDLLIDLQNKLKSTAERHHELAIRLQEYFEKENRLATELETRIKSIEQIEQQLQQITQKQFDLESEKVQVLQRIFQNEVELQEFIDQELLTKNKLNEKKNYVQQLVNTLRDTNDKLMQLRQKMTIYQQEAGKYSEEVANLENEKKSKLTVAQSLQVELETLTIEHQERINQIASLNKDLEASKLEKDTLEKKWVMTHGKNLSLKSQVGLEEALFKKMQQELEKAKRLDEIRFQNLFEDSETQTQHDLDFLESLIDKMNVNRISDDELDTLKSDCIAKIKLAETGSLEQIKQQQILINILEYQTETLAEQGFIASRQMDQSEDITYMLEQIDVLVNKSKSVDVIVGKNHITIGTQRIQRQWITASNFDYSNDNYPLGVLHIVYQLSRYQIIEVALTGTKVIQLSQKI